MTCSASPSGLSWNRSVPGSSCSPCISRSCARDLRPTRHTGEDDEHPSGVRHHLPAAVVGAQPLERRVHGLLQLSDVHRSLLSTIRTSWEEAYQLRAAPQVARSPELRQCRRPHITAGRRQHNNCVLNNLVAGVPAHRARHAVTRALGSVPGVSAAMRRSKMSNDRLQQITTALYMHRCVASPGVIEHRSQSLHAFVARMNRHSDHYVELSGAVELRLPDENHTRVVSFGEAVR